MYMYFPCICKWQNGINDYFEEAGQGGAQAQSKHLLQAVPGHHSPQHAQSWPSLL